MTDLLIRSDRGDLFFVEGAVSPYTHHAAPGAYTVYLLEKSDRVTVSASGAASVSVTFCDDQAAVAAPDDMDESGAAYFYFGWSDFGGGWLVRRQHRATGAHEDATTGAADYASAWAGRASLAYGGV